MPRARRVRPTRSRFVHETIKRKGAFDPRSFRTVPQDSHRITFGCPKGYYSPSTGRCKIGVEVQKILHPIEETALWKNPRGCPFSNPVSARKLLREASELYETGAGRGTVSEYLSRKYRIPEEESMYYVRRAAGRRNPIRKRVYAGKVHEKLEGEIFYSTTKPSEKKYGHLFSFVAGPFKSTKEASKWVRFMGWRPLIKQF